MLLVCIIKNMILMYSPKTAHCQHSNKYYENKQGHIETENNDHLNIILT